MNIYWEKLTFLGFVRQGNWGLQEQVQNLELRYWLLEAALQHQVLGLLRWV
jgi:hypothetical protein